MCPCGNAWYLERMPLLNGWLSWIQPDNLTYVWDLIKPGILKIQEQSKEGWRPEDIYTALKTNSSALHIGYLGEMYLGFMVTTLIPGYRDKSLNVWLCYNDSEEDIISMFSEDLVKLAQNAGAKRISFYSPRNGWERRLKEYGFSPVRTVFEKEL